MSSELQADLDRIASNQFAVVADDVRVTRTVAALEANGISVLRAAKRRGGEADRPGSDLEDARRRIDEYAFPLEDARAQAAYGVRSGVNKVLIINREWTPDRTTVVLVDEALGF